MARFWRRWWSSLAGNVPVVPPEKKPQCITPPYLLGVIAISGNMLGAEFAAELDAAQANPVMMCQLTRPDGLEIRMEVTTGSSHFFLDIGEYRAAFLNTTEENIGRDAPIVLEVIRQASTVGVRVSPEWGPIAMSAMSKLRSDPPNY